MKKLEHLTVGYLTQLEFGQHCKTVYTNITERGESVPPITDTSLNAYLTEFDLKIKAYDRAMVQIQLSQETQLIVEADNLRDRDLICMQRYLSSFEFTSDAGLFASFRNLDALFRSYKNLQYWNFEEESNGIDNLLADLQGEQYSYDVDMLGMIELILKLQASNTSFKTLFNNRIQKEASKEVFNVKQLRSELKMSYDEMIQYVLSMARAKNTAEFNDILSIINTVRKYYHDNVARRPAPKTPAPSEN